MPTATWNLATGEHREGPYRVTGKGRISQHDFAVSVATVLNGGET
jgi:dTDP-4-dehydrorhamnose reductase